MRNLQFITLASFLLSAILFAACESDNSSISIPKKKSKQNETENTQNEAKDEKVSLVTELQLRLERLRPEKQMEKEAIIAENLNKVLKLQAMPRQIYVI